MPRIPLDHLHAHPANANRMPARLMKKLIAHIRERGEYPPLIVRPHPQLSDHYQILDGHHRADALRQLERTEANCEIWNVDDQRAAVLLLTLNRLHGDDDPARRGALMATLNQSLDLQALARLLPDNAKAIRKLMDLALPLPPPAPPPKLDQMPHAITFFLSQPQRDRLLERLDAINVNRSAALVELLELNR